MEEQIYKRDLFVDINRLTLHIFYANMVLTDVCV
jgi:hypothetical protein